MAESALDALGSSRGRPSNPARTTMGGGGGGMSASELRGGIAGMDLLRSQNAALALENESLKRALMSSERDRDQDVRYMRALLGRRLVRTHAQSFKLRRVLIRLHAQVLDLAQVLNIEQRTADQAENTVLSVQEHIPSHNHADHAADQRAAFLASLTRLRPTRVSVALQENLDRLFENMSDVLSRGAKYRIELDSAFARSIELKESLLASEARYDKARVNCEELQQAMDDLQASTQNAQRQNDQLTRDMRLTLDMERKRRLRENQQYIKARTELYKRVLADKDSPLHPAQLARVGKHGANMLDYKGQAVSSGGKSQQQANAAALAQQAWGEAQAQQAAEHQAYYNERRAAQALAQAQADAGYDGMTSEEQVGNGYEAQEQGQEQDQEYPPDAAEEEYPADEEQFEAEQPPPETDLPKSHRSYEAKDQTSFPPISPDKAGPQASEMRRSTSQSSVGGGGGMGKALYQNPFYSPLRPRPSASYAAGVKAEAAYRTSNEWARAQATATTNARMRDAGLEPAPRQLAKKECILHPTHSLTFGATSFNPSFGAAVRTYNNPIGARPAPPINPERWISEFNSPLAIQHAAAATARANGADSPHRRANNSSPSHLSLSSESQPPPPIAPQLQSATAKSAILALDEVRTNATHAAAAAGVHDSILPMRSSFSLASSKRSSRKRDDSPPRNESPSLAYAPSSSSLPGASSSSSASIAHLSTSDWVDAILGESTTPATGNAVRFSPSTSGGTSSSSKKKKKSSSRKSLGQSRKSDGGGSTHTMRTIPISPRLDGGFF